MRTYLAAIALAAMACGGGEQAGQQQTPAATPSAAAPATPPAGGTGTVHSVDMELRDGRYIYSPATLTIRVGDTVRWINVSGGPHNVAFYADKIPAGASDVLNNLMPNRMSPLSGALMIDSLAVYEITFTGSPAGTYEYFCLPHEALGMKATLTIQQ
ncbi:MAG TPA: plastocyanin/azurin family copper-binding protein [Gemmatimonadales bacterium]|nr:plastocyanin/azurin family copper-binding protein [Gemmatimonadales bacterium]